MAPAKDAARQHARKIFTAGLQAADPGRCVHRALSIEGNRIRICATDYPLDQLSRLLVVGAGKATPAMAAAVEETLADHISAGAINTKYEHSLPLIRIATTECGHPVPDQAGVAGTEKILSLLHDVDEHTLVLCLFSGGGSALLPAPADGLSLVDKQEATQLLLACGATIDEINAVRKHLSMVKGGLLARSAHPARVVSLALSDVVGDPLDTIASGPTYPDSTTFADCLELVDRYQLRQRLPAAVRQRLEAGGRGDIPETPKESDPCFARTATHVIGNNALSIDAARDKARQLGYNPLVLSTRIQGEATEVATVLTAIAQEACTSARPVSRPACIICGGETTVTLRGQGKGGRNQELALAAAVHLDGYDRITLLSGGTDGTDGPTDAAGAIVDGFTLERSRQLGLSAADYLANNDSYHFFQALDDLVITGATSTNVMDLQIILVS